MIMLLLGLLDLLVALLALIAINTGYLGDLATVLLWLLFAKAAWTLLSFFFSKG